ncbi:prepilin-type N-terminal cleavage/methylation domain-containing protein [Campylobacter sp. 2018MI27]|uniref:type II secretion system protein n=1 Tax=Campylobacter sp. 2018MI27 TaxID=2836738 RepID=UPI001BD9847B|nr:prepilin-type N-terminal cleavage/methylation domain-containing protein [Campylobacter sp. 2018MI27]MBT0880694.1 prepilin-type N-terminal cleavage/methylation domain-containing protein [Campylobacter sp. 2018MI27]
MKKGFTMIELIFVIVILGILAAVAIPKLNATRDDAEIAKATSNISTLISDVSSYYTAKGQFSATWSDMTNVPKVIKFGSDNCLTFSTNGSNIEAQRDSSASTTNSKCNRLLAISSVSTILGTADANGKHTINLASNTVSW